MKKNLKNKLKSYKFWTNLSASIVLFIECLGRLFNFIPNGVLVNDIIMSICGILVVLGVVTENVPEPKEEKTEKIEITNQMKKEEKIQKNDEKTSK